MFREVIVLREINDLSYREIASVIDAPVGTVMSRLARAARSAARGMDRGRGETVQMTCEEAEVLLHALLDDELDAGHAREIEAHVAGCQRCAAQLRDYRADARGDGGRESAFHRAGGSAPPHRAALPAGLPAPQSRTRPQSAQRVRGRRRRSVRAGRQPGACVVRSDQDQRILSEVVSAHLRSLQAGHLTDVLSTDQHTVKPWFNGKLDVAPPVVDLTAQGFTLIGGRLDYLDGKAVAAIVYRRRVHVINLFIAQASERGAAHHETCKASTSGAGPSRVFSLWAVSDLSADELEDFGRKFEALAGAAAVLEVATVCADRRSTLTVSLYECLPWLATL